MEGTRRGREEGEKEGVGRGSSDETRKSTRPPPPLQEGRQFAAPYQALVNSVVAMSDSFVFLYNLFCPSAVAKSNGFILLYNSSLRLLF